MWLSDYIWPHLHSTIWDYLSSYNTFTVYIYFPSLKHSLAAQYVANTLWRGFQVLPCSSHYPSSWVSQVYHSNYFPCAQCPLSRIHLYPLSESLLKYLPLPSKALITFIQAHSALQQLECSDSWPSPMNFHLTLIPPFTLSSEGLMLPSYIFFLFCLIWLILRYGKMNWSYWTDHKSLCKAHSISSDWCQAPLTCIFEYVLTVTV